MVHVGSEGVREACRRLLDAMKGSKVSFHERTRVLRVEKFGDLFVVDVQTGRKAPRRISAKQLVLATGKSSGLFVRRVCDQLGVEYTGNAIELGVRVEVAGTALDELAKCHLDAKIKYKCDDGTELRTFCMCRGGYLVSCWYDDVEAGDRICTISGFSYANRRSDTSNFGILVRKQFPDGFDALRVQKDIVRAVNQAAHPHGTVVQRLDDFRMGVPSTREGLQESDVASTLQDSVPTNLKWVLPGFVCDRVEEFFGKLGELNPELSKGDNLVHAPVWELCTDRIKLRKGLETSVPGFYVIGDAAGGPRGIIQAATMGVVAARNIMSQWL